MFISTHNDDERLINLSQVQSITLLKKSQRDTKRTQIKFQFVDREFYIIDEDAESIYTDLVRKLTQAH